MAIAAAATWRLLPFAHQRSFGQRLSATGIVGSVTRCCSSCSAAAISPTNSKSAAARLLTNAFLSGSRQLGSLFPRLPARKRRRRTVQASLLGVGAPEVIVIAVVALLVFGPKGLAEVARSLGRTLRAFKPAIQELQAVSTELKQTLQKEIGLDEQPPAGTSFNSRSQKQTPPYSSEDYLKVTEEQVRAFVSEADRKAAEEAAWRGTVPVKTTPPKTAAEERIEPESPAAAAGAAAATAGKPPSREEEQKTEEKQKDE